MSLYSDDNNADDDGDPVYLMMILMLILIRDDYRVQSQIWMNFRKKTSNILVLNDEAGGDEDG